MTPKPDWGPEDRSAFLAFERYFSWAETMRTDFEGRRSAYTDNENQVHWEPYLAYWYGGLFAVTEGWTDLEFEDPEIGGLLGQAETLKILSRYRNGAFHFQRDYFDPRFVDLWESEDVDLLATQLHRAFDRWIQQDLPKILESTFPKRDPR